MYLNIHQFPSFYSKNTIKSVSFQENHYRLYHTLFQYLALTGMGFLPLNSVSINLNEMSERVPDIIADFIKSLLVISIILYNYSKNL